MTSPDPIAACLTGDISPEIAIARLVLAGETETSIRQRLDAIAGRNGYWMTLDRLATAATIRRLRNTIDSADVQHTGAATPAQIAAQFDRAVAASPEASVAMYSLGDPSILAAATGEVVAWLIVNGLIAPDAAVLDLGCGIGRIAGALAPHVRAVHGLDVSAAMVQEATRRCAGLPNVSFAVTAGTDLAPCPDAGFDLVLAADTFPYLVQAGLAERHVAECRRILRSGGHLAVLNLSYRGAPAQDRDDAHAWAHLHDFTIRKHAVRPFRLWDASCWIFRRN